MRDGGCGELALAADRAGRPVRRRACVVRSRIALQRFGVLRIAGQIDQFVGIVLQIVKKLVIAVIEVADVLELLVAQAFKRGMRLRTAKCS